MIDIIVSEIEPILKNGFAEFHIKCKELTCILRITICTRLSACGDDEIDQLLIGADM